MGVGPFIVSVSSPLCQVLTVQGRVEPAVALCAISPVPLLSREDKGCTHNMGTHTRTHSHMHMLSLGKCSTLRPSSAGHGTHTGHHFVTVSVLA